MFSDPLIIIAILVAFSLGGILKGATGAGAPIITIPVIAAFYDVRIAVIIMVIPNLLTNIGQLYQFRKTILPKFFTLSFAIGGGIGAFLGTILLANLSIKILTLSVAFIVIVYILLKLIVPSWKLTYEKAKKLVFLMGGFGGVLQGTAGLSAPISITFLNSMKLERNQFIPTISVYFGVMSIFQMPTLYYYNFLNLEIVLVSCISTLVLLSFMPIGSWIAKSVSKESFDKITLILLGFIAFRIIYLNF
ncbi:sulfite exporter TauE/SafE family protein [Alphaproteobacteria bacterium]|nr:sulfite exporter TauE/SafE family protein [Alphaproteobacteria bacterium]MDA9564597.1 sulfite exporter TauE/SafE family protein [Alphaproteobacteria bacterium]MDB2700981.1 sulfite exporter TauE/SafE family protein [Alphaproteobacteria bacterium]MDC0543712.1 sulfite exporter TauE/SafE family protein [Alphaproteobacteria bacterium]